jgi:OHCU decarboxylase
MTLDELNALDGEAAEQVFRRCCGSSRWAREMAARRPFLDTATMSGDADRIWLALDASDWREAFAAHPRIGEQRQAGGSVGAGGAGGAAAGADRAAPDWPAGEQAGMAAATDAVRDRLARANREYEARFGFIYVVCATGKTAGEMLDIAERRLRHAPGRELAVAAEEQRQITRLRLEKLIS